MNIYYEQLMKFKGADELRETVKKWDTLSENINKRSFDAPIVLPDLFMYTKPGCGNTELISILAEYLDSKRNLMSFYGDVKFFEFKLEYCKPDAEFNELFRLIDSVNTAAGFRNEYKGIIRINIDDWVGHHREKHFIDFLQFLQINTAYWLVILSISTIEENEKTKELESLVSMYLRIQKVTIHHPTNDEFVEYACEHLAKYGFSIDDSGKELLKDSIEVLRKNKYFYGLSTVIDMCNDIVYNLFSETTNVSNIITADMLDDFCAESEYIKRTVTKNKAKKTIGF